MSQGVKIALILGGAIILAVGIYVYFSPYQSCVRAASASADPKQFSGDYIRVRCAELTK